MNVQLICSEAKQTMYDRVQSAAEYRLTFAVDVASANLALFIGEALKWNVSADDLRDNVTKFSNGSRQDQI